LILDGVDRSLPSVMCTPCVPTKIDIVRSCCSIRQVDRRAPGLQTRKPTAEGVVVLGDSAVVTDDLQIKHEVDPREFWWAWTDAEWLTQVQAARLRVKTDHRLGKITPNEVRKVAELPDRKPARR
jgi:hypothetical protein